MRFLLDEQLSERTALALDAFDEDSFEHLLASQVAGADDAAIPEICRSRDVDALITVNVKDFGAKKLLYEALLAAGTSVVVLRPGKSRMDPQGQARLILQHLRRIQSLLREAGEPILIVATPSEARSRTIGNLIDEFE